MAFSDKTGLYRRHVHLWHILSCLTSLAMAYFIMGRRSHSDESEIKDGPFIFGECFTDAILFLSSFALHFGMVMWVTFVAGIIMFRNLPTETFGYIQSKLFPFYFLIGAVTGFIQLAIAIYSTRNISILTWEQITVLTALVSVFLPHMINGIYVGPKSAELMFTRHRMVREAPDKEEIEMNEQYKKIKRRFGVLHGISSLLNLLALAGCVYILFWIAQRFHAAAQVK